MPSRDLVFGRGEDGGTRWDCPPGTPQTIWHGHGGSVSASILDGMHALQWGHVLSDVERSG